LPIRKKNVNANSDPPGEIHGPLRVEHQQQAVVQFVNAANEIARRGVEVSGAVVGGGVHIDTSPISSTAD